VQEVMIVNSSTLLSDRTVQDLIPALQRQVYQDFMPVWGHAVTPIRLSFASMSDIPTLPRNCWPIFLNRHSIDDGLGWHTDDSSENIPIHSRVFVGDNMRAGLSYQSTLSHELLELILDPDAKKVWRMPDGRLISYEACDAVESDDYSYFLGDVRVSNFVLPAYFSTSKNGPYDFRGILTGPCPKLSPGGYASVYDDKTGWRQVYHNRTDGLASRRALAKSLRRSRYMARSADSLEVIE
jgi:hypothetical protein